MLGSCRRAALLALVLAGGHAFTATLHAGGRVRRAGAPPLRMAKDDDAPTARAAIVVSGNVHSGYFKVQCRNELLFNLGIASTFEELEPLTPFSDERRRARIVVEGSQARIDTFVRWCSKGDVGMVMEKNIQLDEVTMGGELEHLEGWKVLHEVAQPSPDADDDSDA